MTEQGVIALASLAVTAIATDAGTPSRRPASRASSNPPGGSSLYRDGILHDLNDLIPLTSGWLLSQASGINNAGEIVGYGSVGGNYHAFLLSPTE